VGNEQREERERFVLTDNLETAVTPPTVEVKEGSSTSEFKLTVTIMFLSALFAFLAAFNIVHLTEGQKQATYDLVKACWTFAPVAYIASRAYVKGKASETATAKALKE
jgi:hypothetical protein